MQNSKTDNAYTVKNTLRKIASRLYLVWQKLRFKKSKTTKPRQNNNLEIDSSEHLSTSSPLSTEEIIFDRLVSSKISTNSLAYSTSMASPPLTEKDSPGKIISPMTLSKPALMFTNMGLEYPSKLSLDDPKTDLSADISDKKAINDQNTNNLANHELVKNISASVVHENINNLNDPDEVLKSVHTLFTVANEDKVEEFFARIKAFSDEQINNYLTRLHIEDGKGVELLTAQQVNDFIYFIIFNEKIITKDLLNLKPGGSLRIARKNDFREPKYQGKGHLPFVLEFNKGFDFEITAFSLPKSKLANYTKDETRKFVGAYKSVTPKILLNPLTENTKLLGEVSKKNYEIYDAKNEVLMASSVFGTGFNIGSIYVDSKKNRAINTSEKAAICDLSAFINPRTRRNIIIKDKDYDPNNFLSSFDKIVTRIMRDMLVSLNKVHVAGIIHNDIKDPNFLIFIDENQQLRAQLTDFGLSIYKHEQIDILTYGKQIKALDKQLKSRVITQEEHEEKEYIIDRNYGRTLPLATPHYASTEVAGFTIQVGNEDIDDLEFISLYYFFVEKGQVSLETFAAQMYVHDKLESRDFTNLKSDPKDDVFSIFITMFILITGHYPSLYPNFNGMVAFKFKNGYQVKYLDLDRALQLFPLLSKFEPLMKLMRANNRNERISSSDALELFDKLQHNNKLENTQEQSSEQSQKLRFRA